MALRTINLDWNTATGYLRATGFPTYLKRQEPVRFVVTTSAEIAATCDLTLALRASGAYDDNPLLTLTGWTRDSTYVWHLDETISSDEIDTFLAANADEADDVTEATAVLDIRAFDANAVQIASSDTLQFTLKNAVGQGGAVFIEDGGGA